MRLKNSNNEFKDKFDVCSKTERFCRKEKYITQIKNNKLHRHITGIRCASNIPVYYEIYTPAYR